MLNKIYFSSMNKTTSLMKMFNFIEVLLFWFIVHQKNELLIILKINFYKARYTSNMREKI